MEKVKILKQPDSSITEDIGDVELGLFTIFAGENNAGKTKVIKTIGEELRKKKVSVIDIPAERVIVSEEIKTGAATDPLRLALGDLIGVKFDIKNIKSLVDDIENILPQEFAKYNVEKTKISVKTNSILEDDYIKAIREVYIKKIINSIIIKDEYCGKDGIKPSEVGQGTERLIIAAILKYLGGKNQVRQSHDLTYIIFEEPEIYLHPKLKESLYNTLSDLATSKGSKIRVIITTHDPYFIDLGRDFKVYKVFRNPKKKYSTDIDEVKSKGRLQYNSSAEINYLVFDLPTPTYFLELYETIKLICMQNNKLKNLTYKEFDDQLASVLKIKQDEKDDYNSDITFITKLRHNLAHPTTKAIAESFDKWGRNAIIGLYEYSK